MYLIVIAWIYVVLMMAVAEGTSTTGTVLGAIVTFVMYGVAPAGLLAYLMGAPSRNKAVKRQAMAEREAHAASLAAQAAAADVNPAASGSADAIAVGLAPDAGGHPAGASHGTADAVTALADEPGVPPVRVKP